MKTSGLTACIVLTGLCISCSTVKENRTPCPCYLVFKEGGRPLDFDREGTFLVSAYDRDGNHVDIPKDVVSWRYLLESGYEVPIEKGLYSISTFCGLRHEIREDNGLYLSGGWQADSLYAGMSVVDCRGEEAAVPIGSGKQFSTVMLDVRYVAEDDMMPYYIRVRGNYGGLDMRTLTALKGDYEIVPAGIGEEGEAYMFRLPRQPHSFSGEIWVELWSRRYERCVDRFNIDKYIRLSGFDWSAESLDDIQIEIDFGRAEVSLFQNGWETTWPMDIEI